MTTLYSYRSQDNVSLQKAIQDCSSVIQKDDTVALLYATNWCKFGKLVDGVLQGSDGQPIKLDAVYEARIFNKDAELRWVNCASGEGLAALLAESELGIDNYELSGSIDVVKSIKQTYLIWGESIDSPQIVEEDWVVADGWGRLTTARIGQLDVPVPNILKNDNRILLNTVEYLAVYEEYGDGEVMDEKRLSRHGNIVVVEERLTGLSRMSDKEGING